VRRDHAKVEDSDHRRRADCPCRRMPRGKAKKSKAAEKSDTAVCTSAASINTFPDTGNMAAAARVAAMASRPVATAYSVEGMPLKSVAASQAYKKIGSDPDFYSGLILATAAARANFSMSLR
jgi:hypothetical protein